MGVSVDLLATLAHWDKMPGTGMLTHGLVSRVTGHRLSRIFIFHPICLKILRPTKLQNMYGSRQAKAEAQIVYSLFSCFIILAGNLWLNAMTINTENVIFEPRQLSLGAMSYGRTQFYLTLESSSREREVTQLGFGLAIYIIEIITRN